ncbi:MAG: family 16 glycosylhydrolase [Bacteroidetes bacterium]|nr:family 16 glycosylhydrolase [Bacteroidota bacterium]
MKIICVLISCFAISVAFAQEWSLKEPLLLRVKKDSIQTLYYHFGDEFNGNALDLSKWHDNYPWGGLNTRDNLVSSPEMVRQENGFLCLSTSKTDRKLTIPDWMLTEAYKRENAQHIIDGNKAQLNYLTSAIYSKEDFRYGYFEARVKAPQEKGIWPAFWTFGHNNKDEIDFTELKGERLDNYHIDIHHPDKKAETYKNILGFRLRFGKWIKSEYPIIERWVTFSGYWEPGRIVFFMDGMPTGIYEGDFATDQNIILNSSVAANGQAFKPGPDANTIFPNTFLVDYVRLWKTNYEPNKGVYADRNASDEKEMAIMNKNEKPQRLNKKRDLKKEEGFISILPTKNKGTVVQVTLAGVSTAVHMSLSQMGNKTSSEFSQTLVNKSQLVNLSHLPAGNYLLRLEYSTKVWEKALKISH